MIAKPDASDKPRLLIIDDDPMICRLMKIQLEIEGYACATLSEPERALEVITETSPALILVDFHLGNQEGLDLLQAIRSREEYKRLPVIVMSGVNRQRESEQAGVDGFMLKPFNVESLLTTIQDVLDRRSDNRGA